HISQLWLLYVVYSFLGSLGLRISYAGLIGNSMKLFWDKKGLATGVIAAAYAAATILIAPIANFLIETQGVVVAFQYLGLSYMLIILAAGFFIQNAPAPNTPLQLSKATTPHLKKPGVELNWRQMLRTKRFYLIVLIFICGSMAGLMLVASASILGQNFFALSAATAAVYVSVYSLCNCLGRFIFGPLSDKLGRYPTLLMICILLTVVLLQAALFQNRFSFLVVLIGVGLGFGGTMSIIPTLVSVNFGLLHCGINYGITYIGYSLGSVCGPLIAAAFTDTGDNIALLFYLSMVFAIAGALFTRLLQKQAIKKRIQL
ncbi:MAG: MFS transporter, partial [Clostridiales bacterium]